MQNEQMRLVLSAWIGSQNLGDEAIAEVVISWLEQAGSVESLTVLSINPAKTRRMATKTTTRVVRAGFLRYVRALHTSDALLLGGGGIIQDESSAINLLFYYLESWVARRILRKPVFWIFVGVGPIRTRLGGWLLKRMGKLTSHTLVRDEASAELLRRYGFRDNQITTAHDIVFNIPNPKAMKSPYTGDFMLFCPRDWFFVQAVIPTRFALERARKNPNSRLHTYRTHLLQLVEAVLRDNPNLTVVGVAFFYSQDLDLLCWIRDNIDATYADRFVVEEHELLPAEFLQVAANAKAVLGVRLHSLILGAVAGRPLVPLVYSTKVASLVNYLGLGDFTTVLDRPDFPVVPAANSVSKAVRQKRMVPSTQLAAVQARNRQAFKELLTIIETELRAG